MKAWLVSIAAIAVVGLLGNQLLQKLDRAADENRRITRELKEARALNSQLQESIEQERAQQRNLLSRQATIQAQLVQRNQYIEVLKRENQELSDWSAVQLPDAAKRLRHRPAIRDAGDYQQWLSERDALPAASKPPTD